MGHRGLSVRKAEGEIMEPGTIIELPDKRRGTVVFHGLSGYGIKFGEITLTAEDKKRILSGIGDLRMMGVREPEVPDNFDLFPEALLREPFEGSSIPCVGSDFIKVK